jgi:plastocyanin
LKSWQVFVFSLIPLALVFIGVIGGSFYGSGAKHEVFPTPAPQPTSSGPQPTAQPGTSVVHIAAKNVKFDQSTITVATGQPVQIVFDNQDPGVLHNVSVYTNKSASQAIFQGEITTGVVEKTYEFKAPIPGTYYFRCDVHPDQMNGTFIVK